MNSHPPVFRRPQLIISGGQTGVDRAALDVAIALGIEHGGWCPRGRRAEDGRIPEVYHLCETPSARYDVRTRRNVALADATLIIAPAPLSGGTALTCAAAERQGKPCLVVDPVAPDAVASATAWLAGLPFAADGAVDCGKGYTLNVAGPRESQVPGIGQAAEQILREILA